MRLTNLRRSTPNQELFRVPPEYTVETEIPSLPRAGTRSRRAGCLTSVFSPEGLTVSLWRSLLINFADRFAPERLPPLQLTPARCSVMLPGELFELPWHHDQQHRQGCFAGGAGRHWKSDLLASTGLLGRRTKRTTESAFHPLLDR